MESPVRATRRGARKNVVVEESDDELSLVVEEQDDEFTPAPRRTSPRKSTRRQTVATAETSPTKSSRRKTTADTEASPRKSTQARKARTGDSIEPTTIFEPDQSMAVDELASPIKKSSPRKRKSAAPTRSRRRSSVTSQAQHPSPETLQSDSSPLADITSKALNRPKETMLQRDDKALQKMQMTEAVLERPMDIAIRARNLTQAAPVVDEPTGPRSRMVIKQLVMTNFKSYAGRQVVGPFHVSFSSVVGPNGSGKSNVIDSLLFVFGFRASKMRQGKISALIHNSAQYQDLDFCEVEVHFQEIIDHPGGQHEVVPESTLIVSRKAFKNNSSNYYLNGRTTNFTTVTTLLKDKGIDLDHKRFLILQGEVESIAQMKPKAANEHDDGLLEYLEDIIGTSKYKTPIEEAAVELETLNEVCMEKQGRVQHVEKEKNALEDKKNRALSYVRDENELAEKQSTLYQIYLAECEDNQKVTEEAIQQLKAQLDAELAKHAGGEDAIKELEKQYRKASKHFEALEKQTQEFVKELAKHDKENVKFEERRKFIAGKQKKAEKLATSSRLAASEAKSLVERFASDIEQRTAESTSLEAEVQQEEQELARIRESLKGKTQGLSDQIAAKQKSLEPWNEKINEKQSSLTVARSELELLGERASAGQRSLDEANAKIQEINDISQAKTEEIEQRQHEKRRLEKDIRKIQDALHKLASSEPEVRGQISSARQKAEEARASLATTQNQGNVLKGLLRLRDSGRIDGFHGRLGNLGTIDEKFDVAISTACPSLENMVVDTVEVGQQCIEYLRKNNLGRANFILLDRLARRDLGAIQTPENVPRLFDLVKFKDQKFAPAFFSIMQNTIVAKDLEQANRIAYGAKRWRVVTLDGQLIDISGTMSGGGTRVARGAMSSKLAAETTKEQVQKLEAERDQLEKQFDAFLDKQKELETSVRDKQESVPKLETEIQKLNLEVENCRRNLSDAQKRVEELEIELSDGTDYGAQITAAEKKVAAFNREIEKLRAGTSSVEAEIQTLQDKIMEVGGIQLRTQKARVDGLRERLGLLNEEISTAEVSKSKNEKLTVKHDKARCEAEKEMDSLARESERLENDVRAHEEGTAGSRSRAEQSQEELEVRKEELSALKKEVDLQTAELNSTRALEIEMRNKIDESQKILTDNQKKGRYWSEKLSKLTLHDIADLEGVDRQLSPQVVEAEATPRGDTDTMDLDGDHTMTDDAVHDERTARTRLPVYTRDELEDKSKDHLVAAIAVLEEKVANASSIDLSVIAEYRRRCDDLATRNTDLNTALRTRDAAKNRVTDLRSLRLTQFMTGFSTISGHLKQMYQLITLGGNAELELVDSLDPFSEGILFSVMPPKKSWKNIGNLSGGEKTLSSLALVFALHVYKPTPLYVMDEIDAALDFRNVSIVAGYIKERTKNAQFIVISLRNNMFELAERLIGIYKVNHMTRSVTVENRDYLRSSQQQQQQQQQQRPVQPPPQIQQVTEARRQ